MRLKSWCNELSHLARELFCVLFFPTPGRENLPECHDHEEHVLRVAASPVHTPAPVNKLVLGYEVGGFVGVGTRVGAAGRRGTARLRESGAKLAAACARDGASPVTVNSAG